MSQNNKFLAHNFKVSI